MVEGRVEVISQMWVYDYGWLTLLAFFGGSWSYREISVQV